MFNLPCSTSGWSLKYGDTLGAGGWLLLWTGLTFHNNSSQLALVRANLWYFNMLHADTVYLYMCIYVYKCVCVSVCILLKQKEDQKQCIKPKCWGILCKTESLSFLTYLRHSMIGFKNLMANQLARQWKVGLPGSEKGTLGRSRRKCLFARRHRRRWM